MWDFRVWPLFCDVIFDVLSSFAIIFLRERERERDRERDRERGFLYLIVFLLSLRCLCSVCLPLDAMC